MKITLKKASDTGLLTAFCLIAIVLICCNACKPFDFHDIVKISESRQFPPDTTQEIVVWRMPNSNPGYLNQWLDSIEKHCGPFNITLFCGSCDSSLMLLKGNGIRTYISGTGGGKGGGTTCTQNCPPSGDGDTLYWSVNFPVDFNDPPDSIYSDSIKTVSITRPFEFKPITVAVFDTGVDTVELRKYLYEDPHRSCLSPFASNGWNFPGATSVVSDDYPAPKKYGHGAIVSRLIVEQANHYLKNDVRILPVKIHNERGESDLFSVLCGFAYAKERGAQIINASFGYYARKSSAGITDPGALLLEKYIEYYLTDHIVPSNKTILLIAAAGNGDHSRNLDHVSFYPASLSTILSNVIAVTTVDDGTTRVSPHQNFSPNVVDIGVNTDVIRVDPVHGDHFDFFNPRINSPSAVSEGSSFATPIVTGIICSHYTEINNQLRATGQAFTKDNILNFLLQAPMGRSTNFSNQLRKGVMFNNAR